MNPQMNREYILSFLEEILNIPSPTGYTKRIMERIGAEAERLGFAAEMTHKGGIIVTVPGRDHAGALGLTAHADTLGAMVRSVNATGTLRLTPVGGYMMQSIENEYCLIHTRDGRTYTGTILTSHPSVHVYTDARDFKREEANMEVRIDEPVRTKEDVAKLGIRPGDFISFDARAVLLGNGYIKSRHLDDKASVAAIFGLLESIRREGWTPARTLRAIITNYEEIGHGASYIPGEITELIAVDMGAIGDDLTTTELDVSICAKDSSGPYDYDMVSRLVSLAEQDGIPYAVDIYPHYGSDASAALRAGHNIRAALIGPGVHASHAMERTHIQAIANTARLLAAYAQEA
ncbi:M42 family metallopeptidase [Paenibacillus sp. MSJ-34]|uniref:M42 family metallopeptidase n=1 Tax=Paenibacillus sp. MSJ-34 TaxID=2841529 RepID=UPI001C11378E|nr:M42 family metallopeptidase [Paenibacillus sp. MSJ-34]MBU5442074.1 M42 family metallopeptidase [Paenibacillus sp. MSJ-34]